jgi:hypothetical protein
MQDFGRRYSLRWYVGSDIACENDSPPTDYFKQNSDQERKL